MNNAVKYTFVANDRFSREVDKINGSLDRTKRGMRGVKAETDRVNKSFQRTSQENKRLVGMAKGWLGFAAVVGTGTKALNSAAAAQKALNRTLSNAANDTISRQLTPEVKKQIDVLRQFGFGIDEIDRALFKMTSQAGLTQETLDSIAGASQLAIGGYADLELAISSTNKQLEAFSDLGGDSQKAARQIFEAQRIGDTSVQALAEFSPASAGAAGAIGLRSAEQLGVLSIFTKPLKNTAAVSEALKALAADIKTGGAGESAKKRRQLGIPTNEVEFRKQGGIVPFLENIARIRTTDAGKIALAEAFTSQEATRLLDFATADRVEALKKGIVSIETGTNLDNAVTTRMQSLEVALNQLSAATDQLFALLGDKIAPPIIALADILTRVLGDKGVDTTRGRVFTPAFLGGDGGAIDKFLEFGTKTIDIATSPINALGRSLGLDSEFEQRKASDAAEAKVLVELRALGLVVERTSVTQDGLDIGVQEK